MNLNPLARTQPTARYESPFLADMLSGGGSAGTQANIVHLDWWWQLRLVPGLPLTGEDTGSTEHQRVFPVRVQTEAGGEGLSARIREISLLSSRIESFAKLPVNWGGDDTILADQPTLNLAKQLVRGLPKKRPLPQVTPSADGEICFTWFKDENRLEAILQPDQHFVWVVRKDGQYAPGRDINLSAAVSFSVFLQALALFYT